MGVLLKNFSAAALRLPPRCRCCVCVVVCALCSLSPQAPEGLRKGASQFYFREELSRPSSPQRVVAELIGLLTISVV